MKKYTALDLFFETELRHIYRAEKAIQENLVTLANTASVPQLKELFLKHKRETETQIHRLEQIFKILGIDIKASKLQGLPKMADQAKQFLKTLADMNFTDRSKGIDGILSEGKELLRHFSSTDANDFALVNAGQKVEHFEIASYNFLSFLADNYGSPEIVDLLEETLNEEIQMDERMSEFAESHLGTLIS